MSKRSQKRSSTLAALLEDKPKRGRPPRAVSRQNVYVALTAEQKAAISRLADHLPEGLSRADVADLAVSLLSVRMEALRRAVAGRNREIPEGITNLDSLYLLWDLPLGATGASPKWTSIRVSPQQAIELGRVQGTLNVVFGTNRSQTFSLALSLLERFLEEHPLEGQAMSLSELHEKIRNIYL